MMKKLFARLRNGKVLLAVISGILLVLVQLGVIDVAMYHNLSISIDTVLSVFVALCIISDPESHLKDK
jgi:uncharacterized membrane protein